MVDWRTQIVDFLRELEPSAAQKAEREERWREYAQVVSEVVAVLNDNEYMRAWVESKEDLGTYRVSVKARPLRLPDCGFTVLDVEITAGLGVHMSSAGRLDAPTPEVFRDHLVTHFTSSNFRWVLNRLYWLNEE